MSAMLSCAGCGASVAPAASFVAEQGNLCATCFATHQNQETEASRQAKNLDRSLLKRAKRNGGVHGIMWVATIILVAHWTGLDNAWITGLSIAAGFGLAFGLAGRSHLAYRAALVADAAATVSLLAAGAVRFSAWWPLLPLAAFPAFLFAINWAIRQAYAPPARTF
jgi:hypothetical protein